MLMTIASEAKLKIAPERFFAEPNVHPRTERSDGKILRREKVGHRVIITFANDSLSCVPRKIGAIVDGGGQRPGSGSFSIHHHDS
jgi:hypothetical protein